MYIFKMLLPMVNYRLCSTKRTIKDGKMYDILITILANTYIVQQIIFYLKPKCHI